MDPFSDSPYPEPDRSFDESSLVWLSGEETFAGLTASEILVYEFLHDVGPVHSSDVQDAVCVKPRTVREALRSLRDDGLIESRTDPNYPNNLVYSIAETE